MNRKGFSLIEAIIALGLFSVASIALLNFTQQFNVKDVKTRLRLTSAYDLASQIISRPEDCNCQFANKVFNSTLSQPSIVLDRITLSCGSAATDLYRRVGVSGVIEPEFYVKDIRLTSIKNTGNPNEYLGELLATPQVSDVSVMRPIPILVRFITDPASPASAKRILSCGSFPLGTPDGVVATRGNAQCSLSWNSITQGSGPFKYNIRYSLSQNGASTGILALSGYTGNSAVVTGLTNGTRYYFAVQAANDYEQSRFSAEASCRPLEPVSNVNLSVINSGNDCISSWSVPNGTPDITYSLKHSTISGGTGSGNVVCSGASTTCTHANLAFGTTHYYRLDATNEANTNSSVEKVCIIPNPVNCIGGWSNCSETCGGGSQTFSILTPAQNGGVACEASHGTTRACNQMACPKCELPWRGAFNQKLYIDHNQSVTAYRVGTSNQCATEAETRTCQRGVLTGSFAFRNCINNVNCIGNWSACSKTCGGGVQTFNIITPRQGNGASCIATQGQTQACNEQPCPGCVPVQSSPNCYITNVCANGNPLIGGYEGAKGIPAQLNINGRTNDVVLLLENMIKFDDPRIRFTRWDKTLKMRCESDHSWRQISHGFCSVNRVLTGDDDPRCR